VNGKVGREEAKKDPKLSQRRKPAPPARTGRDNWSKLAAEGAMKHGVEEGVEAMKKRIFSLR